MKLLVLPPLILSNPNAGVRRTVEVYSRFGRHSVTIVAESSSLQSADSALSGRLPSFASVLQGKTAPFLSLVRGALSLTRAARRNDIVLCYDEYPPSVIYSYMVSKLSRRPYAIFVHIIIPATLEQLDGRNKSFLSRLYRRAVRRSAAVICLDNGKEERLLRSLFPDKQILLSSNGVDTSLLHPSAQGTVKSIDCIFVGVVQERKGVFHLPGVWEKVVSGIPGSRLVLVGKSERDTADRLRAIFSSSGTAGNVEISGFVAEDEKLNLLAASRVFVFPSSDEGISLALLEALSCGIPAVVWDLPIYSSFGEGLVRARFPDENDFASKITELLRNDELRADIGRRGREWVMKNMTWDGAAEREEEPLDNIEKSLKA